MSYIHIHICYLLLFVYESRTFCIDFIYIVLRIKAESKSLQVITEDLAKRNLERHDNDPWRCKTEDHVVR